MGKKRNGASEGIMTGTPEQQQNMGQKSSTDAQLDELIETSDCDAILTENGIYLTRAGIARLKHREESTQQE